jgi:hypothetical protein
MTGAAALATNSGITARWLLVSALFLFSGHCMASVVVLGPLTLEHQTQPGATVDGVIVLQNTGDRQQQVRLYQNDYTFYADGRTLYEEPGRLARSNALWITWSPRQLSIPARETARVSYAIHVPDDSVLRGTYWSLIMIEPEPASPSDAEGPSQGLPGVGIREIVRYAIQIVTDVGALSMAKLTFGRPRVLEGDQGARISVDIENSGERSLRPEVRADLYDAAGDKAGRFTSGGRRLYPGASSRFLADLGQLAAGTYRALIVADCGGDDVFGITAVLVVP